MATLDAIVLTAVLISIPIILILREFACWYFKINKLIKLQQAILEILLKSYEQQGGNVNWESVAGTLNKKFKK